MIRTTESYPMTLSENHWKIYPTVYIRTAVVNIEPDRILTGGWIGAIAVQ